LPLSSQIAKDKKDANLTIETEASVKHSDKLVTTSGLDIQTVGKQLAYTLRSETRWKNKPNNKTSGGVSASYVAGAVALGAKVEDRCVEGFVGAQSAPASRCRARVCPRTH
jgi:hypothetical protein